MPDVVDPLAGAPPSLTARLVNRIPPHVLAHSASPVSYAEGDETLWAEGEPGSGGVPVQGAAFPCVLFMPGAGGAQDSGYRMREVREPTLLYNPLRADGSQVILTNEDELLVTAEELAAVTGAPTVRWLMAGDPQPFGPPGWVYGLQAILRLVRD